MNVLSLLFSMKTTFKTTHGTKQVKPSTIFVKNLAKVLFDPVQRFNQESYELRIEMDAIT